MEQNILFVVFVFLAAAIIVVPFAKATGLGAVLGYLIAGVLIGPFGLRFITDPETILHFSEFGVVMMLFLIGLELQPRELWNMRHRLIGMGLTQVALSTAVFAGGGYLLGMPWQSAIVVGMALALSSTAIALQIMGERGIMGTDAGRSGFSVLLLQDIVVILMLAIIPLLALPHLTPVAEAAGGHGAEAASANAEGADWWMGLRVILVFGGMFLAGRYLLRPVMRFIAKTGVREIFTALALFLVVGAALLMEWIELSAALGAFMVGLILADSEYRHELESNIEPFKSLLLGLFFISVGMSIEFGVLFENPAVIAGLVAALVIGKFAILFGLAKLFRLTLADNLLFAILLAQGGEFAFVLLQFALGAGAIEPGIADILNVTIALSMTITPLLVLLFDRLIMPRLTPAAADPGIPDMGDTSKKVIVLGYGRFGQIATRLLHSQGFETTLIDHDPVQIDLVKRFDFKVFYGEASRIDLLHAAGAADARLIVVALGDRDKVTETCQLCREHFPHVKLIARAVDRGHAFELLDLGVEFERESFLSSLHLGVRALVALGYDMYRATRIAKSFEKHDTEMLVNSHKLRHDDEAYMSYLRKWNTMLSSVMESDRTSSGVGADWNDEDASIDREAEARSE